MGTVNTREARCACGNTGTVVATRPEFPMVNTRRREADIQHPPAAGQTEGVLCTAVWEWVADPGHTVGTVVKGNVNGRTNRWLPERTTVKEMLRPSDPEAVWSGNGWVLP